MRKLYLTFFVFYSLFCAAQQPDSTVVFKKRVLETTEVDLLGSYYKQDGIHSSVGGGTGMEELTDVASDIVIAIPLNDDDVLTIDAGFSAYTSASSGNINPFFTDASYTNGNSGASSRYKAPTSSLTKRDDDDDYETATPAPYGSPWIASTGASRKDVLLSLIHI